MSGPYDDILSLPHHISATRPHMSAIDRAAQFSPFAALTGYDAVIKETARSTVDRIELEEDAKAVINDWLRMLKEQINKHANVSITYFKKDNKKDGGEYVTISSRVKKIDEFMGVVALSDGMIIPFEDIFRIDGDFQDD